MEVIVGLLLLWVLISWFFTKEKVNSDSTSAYTKVRSYKRRDGTSVKFHYRRKSRR